jgi:spermidine/putrescine transport system permease protein
MSRAWRWLREHGVQIYGALAIAYMLIPIAVIAVFSFNDPEGKFNFTWSGFTVEHWENVFGIEPLTDALQTSLLLAALSRPRRWGP